MPDYYSSSSSSTHLLPQQEGKYQSEKQYPAETADEDDGEHGRVRRIVRFEGRAGVGEVGWLAARRQGLGR